MKTEIKFDGDAARLLIQASIPMPQEHQRGVQETSGQSRGSALEQIEALLPAVLSELLYGRSEPQASQTSAATL